jgi:hypothetical protein
MNILTASVGKDGGIISNVDAVKQALEAYVKVRNQSVFESVKEKMKNIAYKASQNTDFAEKADIRNELSSLPITKDGGKKRTGNTQWVGLYKLINWQRKNMGLLPRGGSRKYVVGMKISKKKSFNNTGANDYVKQTQYKIKKIMGDKKAGKGGGFMDGKTKDFLRARARGSKFLRIGWALAASAMGRPFERGDFGPATLERLSGRAYGGGATIDKVAPGQSVFTIWNGAGVFDLRYEGTPMRSSNDIARARAKQEAGLKAGIDAEIKSMYKIVIQRNSQDWFGKKMKVTAV